MNREGIVGIKRIISLSWISLVLVTFDVSATLISVDYKYAGDNYITRDTGTGLDWLDLTWTRNRTYSYVTSQLGADGLYSDWRVANSTETDKLFTNLGMPLGSSDVSGYTPELINFISLFGNLNPSSYSPYRSYGYIDQTFASTDISGAPTQVQMYVGVRGDSSPVKTSYFTHNPGNSGATQPYASAWLGTFLVRDTPAVVPVPASFWLLCSGLVCLIRLGKRKAA